MGSLFNLLVVGINVCFQECGTYAPMSEKGRLQEVRFPAPEA